MKYLATRKPMKCPKCGALNIARIQYGMPVWSHELEIEIKNKTVVLGGCCVSTHSPSWQCISCSTEIYRSDS